jgi:hypothetical protein
MAGDVVPFGTGNGAVFPFTCETEIVGALTADVSVAEMDVEQFGIWGDFFTAFPLARMTV